MREAEIADSILPLILGEFESIVTLLGDSEEEYETDFYGWL